MSHGTGPGHNRDTSPFRQYLLLVEPDEAVRATVEDWLVAAGFEVLGFGDPRDALQAAAFTRFDAVLSRDHMPDMDGMALHRALSEANPDLAARLILMTGGWIDPDIHAFARERRVRLLHLPFQEDELLRLVSEALSGKP